VTGYFFTSDSGNSFEQKEKEIYMLEKLIAKLKELGVIPADKEEAVKTALTELNIDKPQIDTSKLNDPQMKEFIEGVKSQIQILVQENKNLSTLLGAEKTARENAVKASKDADDLKKKSDAEALVADALKNGKILEADKQKYIDKAIADYDGTKEAFAKFATVPGFKAAADTTDKNSPQTKTTLRGPLASADATILGAMAKMEANN